MERSSAGRTRKPDVIVSDTVPDVVQPIKFGRRTDRAAPLSRM